MLDRERRGSQGRRLCCPVFLRTYLYIFVLLFSILRVEFAKQHFQRTDKFRKRETRMLGYSSAKHIRYCFFTISPAPALIHHPLLQESDPCTADEAAPPWHFDFWKCPLNLFSNGDHFCVDLELMVKGTLSTDDVSCCGILKWVYSEKRLCTL